MTPPNRRFRISSICRPSDWLVHPCMPAEHGYPIWKEKNRTFRLSEWWRAYSHAAGG
jgi:hypothetical protein